MTGQTFIDIVQQQARARPTALAYRCGDRRWTFADVERDTNRIANTLAAMGLGRGDRVAALTKFHVEAVLLTLAAAKLGAVCMPVNWRLAPAEVRYIVDHGGQIFKIIPSTGDGTCAPPCAAVDLDCNGTINAADLAVLLGNWGGSGAGDINGDGGVDATDLAALLGAWG